MSENEQLYGGERRNARTLHERFFEFEREKLAQIQALAEAALAAVDREQFRGEAVNWAAVKIIDVEHFYNGDTAGYRVYIDEANSHALEQHIAKVVGDLAFTNVEARTEW